MNAINDRAFSVYNTVVIGFIVAGFMARALTVNNCLLNLYLHILWMLDYKYIIIIIIIIYNKYGVNYNISNSGYIFVVIFINLLIKSSTRQRQPNANTQYNV